jgi:hypothetical protein
MKELSSFCMFAMALLIPVVGMGAATLGDPLVGIAFAVSGVSFAVIYLTYEMKDKAQALQKEDQ